ncbi:MAG: hypothetical protein ACHQ1D_01680 [Nitrososphaerales archaeon]|jgi:hypothetical protein
MTDAYQTHLTDKDSITIVKALMLSAQLIYVEKCITLLKTEDKKYLSKKQIDRVLNFLTIKEIKK